MTAAAHYAVLRPQRPPPPPVAPHQPAGAAPELSAGAPARRHPPAAGTPSRRQPRAAAAANAGCTNTYGASPHAVADSRGGVCAPDGLDENGCCCQTSGNPCDRCAASSCCDTYENCVACCLSPMSAEQRRLVRKNAVHAVLRDAANDFELCRFRCLTNSGSTLHQNSYRSATERHCFGTVRPPLDPRMSINSDTETLQSLTRNGHADRRDPYIGDGRQMIFPCDVEGCAAPEQDIHKLAAKSGSAAAREDKKVRASDRRAKRRPGAVAAEAKR